MKRLPCGFLLVLLLGLLTTRCAAAPDSAHRPTPVREPRLIAPAAAQSLLYRKIAITAPDQVDPIGGLVTDLWVVEPTYVIAQGTATQLQAVADAGFTLQPPQIQDYVARVIRITPVAGAVAIAQVTNLGLDVWEVNAAEQEIIAQGYDTHLRRLQQDGFTATVLFVPTTRLFLPLLQTNGSTVASPSSITAPQQAYHSYEGLQRDLNALAAAFPAIAQVFELGDSHGDDGDVTQADDNRKILAIKISDNVAQEEADEPDVLFLGGHHAREWIAVEVPYLLAKYLVEQYATDARVKELVDHKEIWIVPMVNPDGHEYSRTTDRQWRKNRRDNGDGTFGVDLNRNYEHKWDPLSPGSGTSTVSGNLTYRGPAAFSEPELQAIRNLVLSHDFKAAIDYHSYSQLVLYPWGYTGAAAPNQRLMNDMAQTMATLIQAVHGQTYEPQQATDLYPTNGTSDDWLYFQTMPAFTIELRPVTLAGGGFVLPVEQIAPTFEENLPAALYLIEWVQGEDYGDAPDGPYPTLKASNGARHQDYDNEWLGPDVSGERDANDPDDPDGEPNLKANDPDHDHFDDGVDFFPPYLPCQPGTVQVQVTVKDPKTQKEPAKPATARYGNGKVLILNGWFDWADNGNWTDTYRCEQAAANDHLVWTGGAGDGLVTTFPTSTLKIDPSGWDTISKTLTLTFTVPPAVSPQIWTRFRLEYADANQPLPWPGYAGTVTGPSAYGEVEDYWLTNPITVEEDHFLASWAQVTTESPLGSQTIVLTGPTTVHVYFPHLEGQAQDWDGDGLDQVQTEIVAMELTGDSLLGPVIVRLRPADKAPFQRSLGEIEETANAVPGTLDVPPFTALGTARSFFDVFFEVEIGGQLLHALEPKHMETTIRHKPPAEGDAYFNPDRIRLYTEDNQPTEFFIGSAYHIPNPPPKCEFDLDLSQLPPGPVEPGADHFLETTAGAVKIHFASAEEVQENTKQPLEPTYQIVQNPTASATLIAVSQGWIEIWQNELACHARLDLARVQVSEPPVFASTFDADGNPLAHAQPAQQMGEHLFTVSAGPAPSIGYLVLWSPQSFTLVQVHKN